MLLASTNQYIFLSSSRVYAESKDLLTETSPRLLDCCTDTDYMKTDEYALAKARQEDILLQGNSRNWTIVRPYVTFSDERLQLCSMEKDNWLYRALKGRKIVVAKDLIEKETTFTYGLDVARAIMSIMYKKDALGEVFHITSPNHYKWKVFLEVYRQTIKDFTGKEVEVCYTEHWKDCMGGAYAQVFYDRMYNRMFDNSKISQYIDLATFHDPKDALRICLTNFLQNPHFGYINWEREVGRDRLSGDWSTLFELNGLRSKLWYIKKRFL